MGRKGFFWKWDGNTYAPVPYKKKGRRKQSDGNRCSKSFKGSKKRAFMLKVVRILKREKQFRQIVEWEKKRCVPEYQAFVRAMSEISKQMRWLP